LDNDLKKIFNNKKFRNIGDKPRRMGNFEFIAPGPECDKINKYMKSEENRKWVDFN